MQNENCPIFQMRFPQKLWYLLNTNLESILWGGTGRTILLNYKTLDSYLRCGHSIFKTTHISSFIRQLNLYGFRKVTSHLQDPLCNSSNPDMHEYVHDLFQFGHPELLNKIKRKTFNMKKPQNKAYMSNASETRLQKARKAFRVALRKAAQDLFSYNRYTIGKKSTPHAYIQEMKIGEDWQLHVTDDNKTYQNKYYATNILCKSPEEDAIAVDNSNNEDTVELGFSKGNDFQSPKSEERSVDDYFILPHSQDEGNIIIEVFNQEDVEIKAERSMKVSNSGQSSLLPGFHSKKHLLNLPEGIDCKEDSYEWKYETADDRSVCDSTISKEQDEMKPVTIASIDSSYCGSELKELFYEISKTIDLLNT